MKQLIISFLFVIGAIATYAQSGMEGVKATQACKTTKSVCDRNPLSTKLSLLNGEAQFANHYLNSQEYAGGIFGIEGELGQFFRKWENISWKLTLTHLRSIHDETLPDSGLSNAAETSHISAQCYGIDYAVYYNWLIGDRLHLMAGGSLNLYGDALTGDSNAINNAGSFNGQVQLQATAGARYGWDFEKCGLDIYCNLSTPFMGLMMVDNRYEMSIESLLPTEFNVNEYNHIRFTTPENLQGIDGELGLSLAIKHVAISMAFETKNRWWHAYGLQNYRKNSLLKLGVTLNLLTRPHYKASDRHF